MLDDDRKNTVFGCLFGMLAHRAWRLVRSGERESRDQARPPAAKVIFAAGLISVLVSELPLAGTATIGAAASAKFTYPMQAWLSVSRGAY